MSLITTVTPMTVGTNQAEGDGETWSVVFDGTWRDCDRPQVVITQQDGTQFVIGLGATNSFEPTFLLTFRDKVYAACDTFLAFSAIGEPSQFQDRVVVGAEDADAPGNGYIVPGNNYGSPETIQCMQIYQGKMAIFCRNSVQIWSMQSDPANNAQEQVLENIGTVAPLSAQPIGTMDVMFLSETGLRSLRVRDSSNNAIVVDVGTPVDTVVQALLAELTDAEKATACGITEPSANRYWCYIPAPDGGEGKILVFSYFPTTNIAAWSVYRPTYLVGETHTPFVPRKFMVKDGRVYAWTDDGLIAYGGEDGNTYENCGMTMETPWMDAKTPATRKHSKAIDVACQGTWAVSLGMDPHSATLEPAYNNANATNASSFNLGQVPVRMQGTHFKLKMVESGSGYARFSSAAFHFEPAESK